MLFFYLDKKFVIFLKQGFFYFISYVPKGQFRAPEIFSHWSSAPPVWQEAISIFPLWDHGDNDFAPISPRDAEDRRHQRNSAAEYNWSDFLKAVGRANVHVSHGHCKLKAQSGILSPTQ